MTRLSAHIGYLYTDLPLAARPAAAARDGFTAVEHPEPWSVPAGDMRSICADLGLTFVQVSTGMGEAGEKGLASLPGRETAFREGFKRALDYAVEVGTAYIHPMAGTEGDLAIWQDNVGFALDEIQGTSPRLLVEAITIPGYTIGTLDLASRMQDALQGSFDLLFDTFHAATLGHDPAEWITRNAQRIGHVHIADHPGRREPGTGALDFPAILTALQAARYAGAIGFEYIPSTATSASAAFLPGWKARLAQGTET